MLICYVIAHTLWLEIRTPEEVYIYNVDNINYVNENLEYPGSLYIATNDIHDRIYLENVTIKDFENCLAKAYQK